MALDKLAVLPGVQMLLANIIKAAAPELVETVGEFSQLVIDFNHKLDELKAQNDEILTILKGEQHGEFRGPVNGIRKAVEGAGRETSE